MTVGWELSKLIRYEKKSKVSANLVVLIHFSHFQISLFTAAQRLQTYTLNESVNISLKFPQKCLIHSQGMSSEFLFSPVTLKKH